MIKMTPEDVRSRASEYSTQATNLDGIISKMDSLLAQLQSEWEGKAAEGFAYKFNELKPGFTKARDLINEIASKLNATANRMETVDEDAGSSWRS